jgi:hypothetical protein
MTTEPVTITAAITAAITSTLAILLFFGVDPDVVAAITVAATGWIGVAAVLVRGKVTPVDDPTLTPAQIVKAQTNV